MTSVKVEYEVERNLLLSSTCCCCDWGYILSFIQQEKKGGGGGGNPVGRARGSWSGDRGIWALVVSVSVKSDRLRQKSWTPHSVSARESVKLPSC